MTQEPNYKVLSVNTAAAIPVPQSLGLDGYPVNSIGVMTAPAGVNFFLHFGPSGQGIPAAVGRMLTWDKCVAGTLDVFITSDAGVAGAAVVVAAASPLEVL